VIEGHMQYANSIRKNNLTIPTLDEWWKARK
jgi:hypothetical protein